jgi:hypothetical protein
MSTQHPDPYGIDAGEDAHEVFTPQREADNRARSPTMTAIALEPGRTCVGCGYDLTGLFVGGNCPECGDKILSISPNSDIQAYKRMPEWYLRLLGFALSALAVSGVLVIVAQGLIIARVVTGMASTLIADLFLQIVAMTWFAGILVLCCPPPEKEPRLGIGRSRWELALAGAAAISQAFVLVTLLHPLVLGGVNRTVFWWSSNIAFYGLFLVALQCSNVSWRLNDEDRAQRLQSAGLSIPLGSGMVYLFGWVIGAHVPFLSLFGVPFLVLQIIGLCLWVWGCFYLLWSFGSLSRESFWAIRNTRTAQARIERLKERARADSERARRERDANQPFGGPIA